MAAQVVYSPIQSEMGWKLASKWNFTDETFHSACCQPCIWNNHILQKIFLATTYWERSRTIEEKTLIEGILLTVLTITRSQWELGQISGARTSIKQFQKIKKWIIIEWSQINRSFHGQRDAKKMNTWLYNMNEYFDLLLIGNLQMHLNYQTMMNFAITLFTSTASHWSYMNVMSQAISHSREDFRAATRTEFILFDHVRSLYFIEVLLNTLLSSKICVWLFQTWSMVKILIFSVHNRNHKWDWNFQKLALIMLIMPRQSHSMLIVPCSHLTCFQVDSSIMPHRLWIFEIKS